jgi:hypothetical protein
MLPAVKRVCAATLGMVERSLVSQKFSGSSTIFLQALPRARCFGGQAASPNRVATWARGSISRPYIQLIDRHFGTRSPSTIASIADAGKSVLQLLPPPPQQQQWSTPAFPASSLPPAPAPHALVASFSSAAADCAAARIFKRFFEDGFASDFQASFRSLHNKDFQQHFQTTFRKGFPKGFLKMASQIL